MYCVLGEGGKIRSSSCVHKKPFPSITNSSSIGVQDKISKIEGKQCQSQIPPHGCNSIPPTNHTYHGNVMKELQNSYQYDNRLQSGQSSCTQVGGGNLDSSVVEHLQRTLNPSTERPQVPAKTFKSGLQPLWWLAGNHLPYSPS